MIALWDDKAVQVIENTGFSEVVLLKLRIMELENEVQKLKETK